MDLGYEYGQFKLSKEAKNPVFWIFPRKIHEGRLLTKQYNDHADIQPIFTRESTKRSEKTSLYDIIFVT